MKIILVSILVNFSINITAQEMADLKKVDNNCEMRINSNKYKSYYVINDLKDTIWLCENSSVWSIKSIAMHEKHHNLHTFSSFGKPYTGYIYYKLYLSDTSYSTYIGTMNNGKFVDGYFTSFYNENKIKRTGQYQNNWKYGFWTSYFENGQIEYLEKYIVEIPDPVKFWQFDENGKLIEFEDIEREMILRIKLK